MRLYLILLLFVLAIAQTNAASCPYNTDPLDQAGCYAARAQCHWDTVANVCSLGTPSTCADYYTDTVGCAASTNPCTQNYFTNVCYDPLPTCESLATDLVSCSKRSDCHADTGLCVTGSTSGTCGTKSTLSACQSAGCYWDEWVTSGGECFYNLQEVNLNYACDHWSYYPTNQACLSHGCANSGTMCFAVDSGALSVDGGYSTSTEIAFTAINPAVTVNTLTFSADIQIPLDKFWQPTHPVHYSINVGRPTTDSYLNFLSPSRCTTIGATVTPDTPIYASTVLDQTSLFTNFLNYIQTNTDISSVSADAKVVVGDWHQASGPTNLLGDLSTTIVGGLTHIQFHIHGDLDRWALECGVTRVVSSNYTGYDVPITIMARSNGGNIAQATKTFTVNIGTYGSIQITGTTKNAMTVSEQQVFDEQGSCTSLEQRRTFTIKEVYTNAADTTKIVGLRTLADVSMRAPDSVPGVPTNCFGTEPYEVVPPTSCPGNQCTTLIRFRTRCNVVVPDGDSLNLCNHQPSAVRISEMGSDIAYPGSLDYSHSFFDYPRSWSSSIGITDPDFTSVGQDSTGAQPDQVVISINQPTYPSGVISKDLTVRVGLLPTPDADFSTQVLELTNTETGTSITDLNNKQIYFTKDLTVMIYFPSDAERTTFGLEIDITTVRFYPVTSSGSTLFGGTVYLTWVQIQAAVLDSPREALIGCSTCSLLPTITANTFIGADGFSVPVYWLKQLLPANGYRIEFSWKATLPAIGGALLPAINARRLLSADAWSQGGLISVTLVDKSAADTNQTLIGWDAGSTSTSASSSISTAIYTTLSVAVVGGAWGFGIYPFLVKAAIL